MVPTSSDFPTEIPKLKNMNFISFRENIFSVATSGSRDYVFCWLLNRHDNAESFISQRVFWEYSRVFRKKRIDSKLDKEFFSSVVDHYILIYLYLKYNIYNMYREWTDLTNKIERAKIETWMKWWVKRIFLKCSKISFLSSLSPLCNTAIIRLNSEVLCDSV